LQAKQTVMLQQQKSPLGAEKTNPARKLFDKQGHKLGHVTSKNDDNVTKKSPAKLDEKEVKTKK